MPQLLIVGAAHVSVAEVWSVLYFVMETEAGGPCAAAVARKTRAAVLPWLWLASVLCYVDRAAVAFAAADLERDAGLSDAQYGLGAGLFFAAYCALEVPSNLALARRGAVASLARILVCWGCAAAAHALITGPATFYAARLALGAAEAGAYPGMMYLLTQWFDAAEYKSAYSVIATGSAFAGVVGGFLAAGLLQLDGVLGLRGWQWLFLAEAAPTIVLGVTLQRLLPESPKDATFLTAAERRWLVDRQAREAARKASGDTKGMEAVKAVVRNRRVWHLGLAWALNCAAYYGILFFGPLIVAELVDGEGHDDERHSSSVGALLVTSLLYAVAAGAVLANAEHSRRTGEWKRHVVVPLSLSAVCLAAVAPVKNAGMPGLALVLVMLSNAGVWSIYGPYGTQWQGIASGEAGAVAFAIINSSGSLGGFVGPFLLGATGEQVGGQVLAAALGAAAFLAALYEPPEQSTGFQRLDDDSAEGGVADSAIG